MQRRAECACGQLKVLLEGDPLAVAVCSCTACQKRTGSAFGVSAFFDTESQLVSIEGHHKAFTRSTQGDRSVEHHFCPQCGSTVFWYAEKFAGRIGLAAGSFADPDFPAPQAAVWDITRHRWIDFPTSLRIFQEGIT